MRFTTTILVGLLGTASALPSLNLERSSASAISKRTTFDSAVGLKFDINGSVGYYAGSNSYWIGFLTKNADIDLVFQEMKSSGLKVLRVWGFNDITASTSGVWFQSFVKGQPVKINTGANGLQRLDYVVSSAAAHGISLIINFVNNWTDYGGMAAYCSYYGIADQTGWYTSAAAQAQYQAYIKAVVSRYSTSPAIFSWELANEPRCHGCPTSVVTTWATTTSAYIKSLDPNHMVTMGDEGFMNGGGDRSYPYTTAEGIDFAANLKIPGLDFGTFHLYPTSWGTAGKDNGLAWGQDWIKNHAAACAAAGKPCVLEEYGVPTGHVAVEAPWQKTSLTTTGMGGDMFWQFGTTDSNGQTANDGYTIYYKNSEWQTLVDQHVAAINAASTSSPPPPPPPPAPISSITSSAPVMSSTAYATTALPTSIYMPTSTDMPMTTSTDAPYSTPTDVSTSGTIAKWAQCGGQSWSGSGSCVDGTECMVSNPWYSQCL